MSSYRGEIKFFWVVFILCTAIFNVAQINYRGFSVNLLQFLPNNQKEKVEINNIMQKELTSYGQILISHSNQNYLLEVAKKIAISLIAENNFITIIRPNSLSQKSIDDFYKSYKYKLLSKDDKQYLIDDDTYYFTERTLSSLYGLDNSVPIQTIQKMPFLTDEYFYQSLPNLFENIEIQDEFSIISKNSKFYIPIQFKLNQSFLDGEVIVEFGNWFKSISQEYTNLEIIESGAIFHALKSTSIIKNEIVLISTFSIIIILLVLWATFKSSLGFIYPFIGVIGGSNIALASGFLLFDNLHLISVLFGCSIIGLTIDYGFHICCQWLKINHNKNDNSLNRSLVWGGVTTSLGFATFYFTPLPGVHQMAIMTSVGVLSGLFTALLIIPQYHKVPISFPIWANFIYKYVHTISSINMNIKIGLFMLPLMSLILCIQHIEFDDGIKALGVNLKDLEQKQLLTFNIMDIEAKDKFVYFLNENDDTLLNQQGDFLKDLSYLKPLFVINHFAPSPSQQVENYHLIGKLYSKDGLENIKDSLPIELDIGEIRDEYGKYSSPTSFDWAKFPFKELFENKNRFSYRNNILYVIPVSADMRISKKWQDHIIYPKEIYKKSFSEYRMQTFSLLIVAALIVTILMIIAFGFKGAIHIFAPIVATLCFIPFFWVMFNQKLTFLSIQSLILVIAIGLDYTIFYYARHNFIKETMMATLLSAVTTISAFGFLSFSQNGAIHSFGFTVFIGIILMWFLAPFSIKS